MFRSGKECETAGTYRSNDCGYEVTLIEKESFPDCPLHGRPVTWTFVRKTDPPRKRRRPKPQKKEDPSG